MIIDCDNVMIYNSRAVVAEVGLVGFESATYFIDLQL